jgi:hypothetical protein
LADAIPGWLTKDQARLLWDSALTLGKGERILEIGSHKGRSTVVLALAAQRIGARVTAVDPFVDGRLFGGSPTRVLFEENIATSGVSDTVDLVPEYSTRLRPQWTEPFQMLYIDGKHDYWTFTDDLRWAVHLPPAAPILVHDCYSSIGVTLGVLARVLPGRGVAYRRRAGSLALFVVGRPSAADRMLIVRELPWWLRNVGVKILLRLRLRSAARLFGHDHPYDPY